MLKRQIFNYLKIQKLMTISTFGNEPWPAIVYFLHDQDLNLYFVSHPDDYHSKNIEINPKVACTIYDSTQPNWAQKKGIQLNGTVEVVNNLAKVTQMVKLWNKIIAKEEGVRFKPEQLLKAGSSRVYKVKPHMIKFFNEELYPDDKGNVLTLNS